MKQTTNRNRLKLFRINIFKAAFALVILRLGFEYGSIYIPDPSRIINSYSFELPSGEVFTSNITRAFALQKTGQLLSLLGLEWLLLHFSKAAKKIRSNSLLYIASLAFLFKESLSTLERILTQLYGLKMPIFNGEYNNASLIWGVVTLVSIITVSTLKLTKSFNRIQSDRYHNNTSYFYITKPKTFKGHIKALFRKVPYEDCGYIINGMQYSVMTGNSCEFKKNANYKLAKVVKYERVINHELGKHIGRKYLKEHNIDIKDLFKI